MNLRSLLMEKLAALRTATDRISATIDALDAINPPVIPCPSSTAADATTATPDGLFGGKTDG